MINTLLKRRMENTKKNKKGFTLVELIVVLVIIAILAAVLVPTVSGYIGKAKKTAAESACKNVVTAASSAGTDLIATSDVIKASDASSFKASLKEVGGKDILKGVSAITVEAATGSVLYVEYTDGKYSCVYKDGKYVTSKSLPSANSNYDANSNVITSGASANGGVKLITATPSDGEKPEGDTAAAA